MRALFRIDIENRRWAGVPFCVSSALRCESSAFLCGLGTSASATGYHDLLREEELVDFLAVVPRLDDAEPDGLFAVVRGRLGDESLDVDFFAAGRGRLDVVAVGAGFFAGLLAAGPDTD
jgi:hypothetical protein